MNVAYLVGALNRGGAETLILDIFKQKQNGINFCCIYRKSGNLYKEFSETGIPLIHLKPKSIVDIIYILRLRQLQKRNSIDIIHTHQLIDATAVVLSNIFSKRKSVLTFHGHELNKSLASGILRKIILKLNNQNVFVSNSQLEYFKKRDRLKFRNKVIYNGINFDKISSSDNLRIELKINEGVLLTGSVGNFTTGRDPLFICKFLRNLQQQDIHFFHIFIGGKSQAEPEVFDNCINFCKENNLDKNVKFLGLRNDVPAILPQLDAYLYATRNDTFGLTLIEAISAEIPVFVNNTDVMKEITFNGKYACIYPSQDLEQLMVLFKDFIENKQLYKEKAIESSKAIKQHYSIQEHIQQLKELYTDLLNEKKCKSHRSC